VCSLCLPVFSDLDPRDPLLLCHQDPLFFVKIRKKLLVFLNFLAFARYVLMNAVAEFIDP
jgi:hypothetical protein